MRIIAIFALIIFIPCIDAQEIVKKKSWVFSYPCRICGEDSGIDFKNVNEDPVRHALNAHTALYRECAFCNFECEPTEEKTEWQKELRDHIKIEHPHFLIGFLHAVFSYTFDFNKIKSWSENYWSKLCDSQSFERKLYDAVLTCQICTKNVPFLSALFHVIEDHWFLDKACNEKIIVPAKKRHNFNNWSALKHTLSCTDAKVSLDNALAVTFPSIVAQWKNNVLVVKTRDSKESPSSCNVFEHEFKFACAECNAEFSEKDYKETYQHVAMHCIEKYANASFLKCYVCGLTYSHDCRQKLLEHLYCKHITELAQKINAV